MEALLEYRQTDVCYGGVRAVRGVSFTLHAGEILGVVEDGRQLVDMVYLKKSL